MLVKRLLLSGLLMAVGGSSAAGAAVVYSSYPSPVPPNVDSLIYEDSATSEFGDAISLAGTDRSLTSATILFSSWALQSDYAGTGTSAGYSVPMTLSFYNFASSGPNPTVGSLIGSQTIAALLPWRPPATPNTCTDGNYMAGDGYCYTGVSAPVTFTFSDLLLPTNVIYGLSFDTQDYGSQPSETAEPANGLGFGLYLGATTGTDVNTDGVEWNTANGSARSIGQPGLFGPDIGWAGSVPAIELLAETVVPEPGSLALLGPVLVVAVAAVRRRTQR